ncbi:MAG: 3-deoxy-D-manno-octulosonic acid transferase [Candidatus Zixiibacteriota bacterium]
MYFIYNLFLTVVFILLFPFLYLWAVAGKHGVRERLGKLPQKTEEWFSSRQVLWFHAASVGEIKLLSSVIPKIKKKKPDYSIVVSTLTKAGKNEGQRSLKGVDLFFYLPVDFPFLVRKILKRINPRALIIVETEIWPNLIREAKKYGVRIALINGRFSPKSFQKYLKFKSFFSNVLSFYDLFCMRTEEDSKRLLLLGANPAKVKVVGNLKYDITISDQLSMNPDDLKEDLGIPAGSKVVVAGSTEQGEERMVLDVFKRLKQDIPDLFLILAPRHLNRIKQVENELIGTGLKYQKRTQMKKESGAKVNCNVILLDTIGQLLSLYSIAEVAFVGGSLIPFGGHNILEPAMHSVPVLFGPYMDHFKESSELLIKSGGGVLVKDKEELFLKISQILKDEEKKKRVGQMAFDFIKRHQGSSDKTVDLILNLINES